jgi:hypothetical protein
MITNKNYTLAPQDWTTVITKPPFTGSVVMVSGWNLNMSTIAPMTLAETIVATTDRILRVNRHKLVGNTPK